MPKDPPLEVSDMGIRPDADRNDALPPCNVPPRGLIKDIGDSSDIGFDPVLSRLQPKALRVLGTLTPALPLLLSVPALPLLLLSVIT
eukprot:m.94061 g.94061  ORF g.94061 m.94061 type:complete len:87 (-) comp15110_c0_seq1:35-295(-)